MIDGWDILAGVGALSVVGGAYLLCPPAALIVAGVGALAFWWFGDRGKVKR